MTAWARKLLLTGLILLMPAFARAADTEVREFSITIDGKPAGTYSMTITRLDAHTIRMNALAQTKVSYLGGIYKYTYSFMGSEQWQDGKLVHLDSNSNDNGTKYTVMGRADRQGLRMKVNGKDFIARPDVWTTTYWQLPPANQRNHPLPLLDADTGKAMNGSLQYAGNSFVRVLGQNQNCAHYRVSGAVKVDLWYDGHDRLVRQDWVEDGHRAILELVRIR